MAKKPTLWDSDADPGLSLNIAAPTLKDDRWKRRTARRALSIIAFVGVPVLGFMALSTALEAANAPKPETPLTSIGANDSLGKAEALDAIQQWMNADPSPLPDGRIVSWDGYSVLSDPELPENTKVELPTFDTEVHQFTLAVGSGKEIALFATTIEVRVDPVLGAKVVGAPTLIPRAPSNADGLAGGGSWVGWNDAQASPAVDDAVTAWVTAFTSGEPNRLRLAVGDPDPENSYVPLNGATASKVTIIDSGSDPMIDSKATVTQIILRVTFAVQWGEIVPLAQGKQAPDLPTLTYDVLVNKADTASPVVVAWGGAGSGPSLKPFSNAIAGIELKAATETFSPKSTDAPTSTLAPDANTEVNNG